MPLSISRWSVLLADVLIVLLSVLAAYFLRFNFHIPKSEWRLMFWAISVILTLRLLSFGVFRTFAGAVFYTSIEDARRIFKAVTSGTVALGVINWGLNHLYGYYLMPNSVVIIDYLATMFLMSAMRIFIKTIYLEYKNHNKDRKSIIIYGSHHEAVVAKKALERDPKTSYHIVAFIAESSHLYGQKIADIPIFTIDDLPRLFAANVIDSLIIAAAHVAPDRKQRLIDIGLTQNITVRSVPPMERWINGELSARQIREVRIEDLLEREPIQLDTENLRHQIMGKVVLVTGAAGSIGSEIARQLIQFHPKRLILLDQAETPLFELDLELHQHLHFKNHEVVIADVRNKERMQRVFEAFAPQIIYHAAAYKHVPMMENNPSEAILTNIGGTRILADCAVQYGAERFVFVSTDKAVNPTNIMGASKRVAEIYVQSLNDHLRKQSQAKPLFITTRFGNVLGSNGSVIPLFKKQIAAGGPLTVTHPEMTRYFMTIPEACQLVLEAGVMGSGGEIFVFDMGESVKIIDLAKNMVRLSGLELGKDIQIVFTGLRPGEKLYEELLNNEEQVLPTHHHKILIAKIRANDFIFTAEKVTLLQKLFNHQDNIALVTLLKELVPEYKSNNSEYEILDKFNT